MKYTKNERGVFGLCYSIIISEVPSKLTNTGSQKN